LLHDQVQNDGMTADDVGASQTVDDGHVSVIPQGANRATVPPPPHARAATIVAATAMNRLRVTIRKQDREW
jgi:hypothetical protein